MNHIFTKTRLKVFFGLILLIGISVGSYYLYGYYQDRFVTPYAVLVKFNRGITQEEALSMLEKYKAGISTRTPRNYDHPNFASYENFEQRTIQFTVNGWYRSKSISNLLSQELIVQFPNNPNEIEFLERILAYFFN